MSNYYTDNSTDIYLSKNKRYLLVIKLSNILELISRCDSRIGIECNYSKETFGLSDNGLIKCTNYSYRIINKYTAIRERLKVYYNNQLTLLTVYEI